MKKTLNFFFAIAALAGMFSCAKMEPAEQTTDIPEGYSKVYFTAGVADTKTTLNGTSIEWQGTEQVNIWYKDAEGVAQKAAATIESCSGKTANFSAFIPNNAPKDEFIAELNGVIDAGRLPFGTGDSRPRCKVNPEQTAVKGSYDPTSFSMAARWKKNGEEEPFFQFNNLVNLLKVSVTNNTGRTLKKIELSNPVPEGEESKKFSIASNNWWEVKDDGTLAMNGSTTGSTSVTLAGDDIEDGDYYFVLSTKNQGGFVTLQNMKVIFHFEGGAVRTFSNPNELSMSAYNLLVPIGSFVINSEDLDIEESINPTYAPFGTEWRSGFLSDWQKKYVKDVFYEAVASVVPEGSGYSPIGYVKAKKSNGDATISTSSIGGIFTFEFYAAESGKGILSFTAKTGSTATTERQIKVQVKRDNVTVQEEVYKDLNSPVKNLSFELDVESGDLIHFEHGGGTNNGVLYLYRSSANTPISWTRKTE